MFYIIFIKGQKYIAYIICLTISLCKLVQTCILNIVAYIFISNEFFFLMQFLIFLLSNWNYVGIKPFFNRLLFLIRVTNG